MKHSTHTLICGAGIAGISTAYHLAVRQDIEEIVLVDERAPMTLTSDKSTECYRNWWPGPGDDMVRFMNRSIDIMETLAQESGNIFHLNRRGYLYLTASPERLDDFAAAARIPSNLGAGDLRIHRGSSGDPPYQPHTPIGFRGAPSGADLFLDAGTIQKHFPYLPGKVCGALHVRRAGWLSAQQLGMYMLEEARSMGVTFIKARLTDLKLEKGKVRSATLLDLEDDREMTITLRKFVNAGGPKARDVGNMLGVELPLQHEVHLKTALRDAKGVVPRQAPLLIWHDPQKLPWTEEERRFLSRDEDTRWLLEEMPPGAHTRPEGGNGSDIILLLWEYATHTMKPSFPPPLDSMYPEIVLRGMAAMLPDFKKYFQRLPQPILDGGYYTKTPENRPLITPLPVENAYLVGALSGYGIMAACAAGELAAAHITDDQLPDYAPAFHIDRYQDPAYQTLLQSWEEDGQL